MPKEDGVTPAEGLEVDDQKEAAAYQGHGKMNTDTTDNGWGKGVFAEAGTPPPLPARKAKADDDQVDLRKIRKSERPEGEDAVPEEEPVSLVLPLAVGAGGLLMLLAVLGLYLGGIL